MMNDQKVCYKRTHIVAGILLDLKLRSNIYGCDEVIVVFKSPTGEIHTESAEEVYLTNV